MLVFSNQLVRGGEWIFFLFLLWGLLWVFPYCYEEWPINSPIATRRLLLGFKMKAFVVCQQFLLRWTSKREGTIQARQTCPPTQQRHLTLIKKEEAIQARQTCSPTQRSHLTLLQSVHLSHILRITVSSLAWNLMETGFAQRPPPDQQRKSSGLWGAASSPPTVTTVEENSGRHQQWST